MVDGISLGFEFRCPFTVSRSNFSRVRGGKPMAASMRSARLHEPGQPLRIDTVEIPEPRPPQVTFEQAARFGYLGTSYAALRLGQVRGGSWVAINGITGTLGVGATLLALAMGATRILGLGRNRDVLAQLRALAPDRVEVLALGDAPIADWMRRHTDQLGVDVLIDCSARSAAAANTAEALGALKRGAIAVNIGALTEPLAIQPIRFMTARLQF